MGPVGESMGVVGGQGAGLPIRQETGVCKVSYELLMPVLWSAKISASSFISNECLCF